jgi:hypothetical protein
MKNNILAAAILCSAIASVGISASAQAEMGKSVIGPSLAIGNGNTSFGIDSKFGIADNISLRPAIYFGNGATVIGSALTYDFDLRAAGNASKITPFLGGAVFLGTSGGNNATIAGFVGGADFDISNDIQLKGAINVPITNNAGAGSTFVTLGAGFKF